MKKNQLFFPLLCCSALFLSASTTHAEENKTPVISPHCQKMMMIGCALTKDSKGKNAKAADEECAELLKEGECATPVKAIIAPTGAPKNTSPEIEAIDNPNTPKDLITLDSIIEDTQDAELTKTITQSQPSAPIPAQEKSTETPSPAIIAKPAPEISQTPVAPIIAKEAEKKNTATQLAPVAAQPKEVPAATIPEKPVVELAPVVTSTEPKPAVSTPAVISTPPVISTTVETPPSTTQPTPAPTSIATPALQTQTDAMLSLAFGTTVLIPDQPNDVTLYLRRNADNSPVTTQDIKDDHSQKLRLLIVDPSLKEYHHVLPQTGSQAGEYRFTFTPNQSYYHVFAQVTLLGKDETLMVPALLGVRPVEPSRIDTVTRYESSADGINAVLSLDAKPKSGLSIMGSLKLRDNAGAPIKDLEPMAGSYSHITAFSQDLVHVAIAHPLGASPFSLKDRGGDELQFQIKPEVSGFTRVFVQITRGGKEYTIPFGFTVE